MLGGGSGGANVVVMIGGVLSWFGLDKISCNVDCLTSFRFEEESEMVMIHRKAAAFMFTYK